MFSCNSLSLLNFTYYLKIVLGISMTIIPFILLEKMFIQCIRYKQKNTKFDKIFIKKQGKNLFYIISIFLLAFSLHMVINREDNVCYMYATKDVIKEYKTAVKAINKYEVKEEAKEKFLANIIVSTYESSQNKNNSPKSTINKNDTTEEKKDNNSTVQQISNKEDNFLNETDYNTQNNIYVVNGNFFIPQYTLSGKTCPSDPLNEGYNNPYGYNNYFYIRLTRFVDEAAKNGYKITISSQGCRTYATQVNYYNTMTPGRAASPGYSMHGFGIASDLEFYQSNGQVCSYGRTDESCPSMGWAHNNANRFGLNFPLLYASYREDWHVEPALETRY